MSAFGHKGKNTVGRCGKLVQHRDQAAFFERVVDPASPWIHIVEHRGFEAIAGVVQDLADGVSDPAEGAIGVIAR